MIIPQLIRKLLPLWIVIFVLSCLGTFAAFVLPYPWTWLSAVFVFLAGVSYCAFMFGASLVCIIENALLRWFGQPATATVLDFHGIKTGNNRYTGNEYNGVRVKLEVHTPEGGSFVNVAEDSSAVGEQLEEGKSYPVKYDPLTKEVALVAMPKQPKPKEKDF